MPSAVLIGLLELFDAHGITVWLDGGWAVDAALGTQSRSHKDVDIIVTLVDVPKLQLILGRRGR